MLRCLLPRTGPSLRSLDKSHVSHHMLPRAALCVAILASAGCATIKHGSVQRVTVVSNPAGARVMVDSQPAGVTPLVVKVSRRGRHVITMTHDTFPAMAVPLTRHISPAVYGNLLLYGLPALVDLATGSAWEQRPSIVSGAFSVTGPGSGDVARMWGLARNDRVRFSIDRAGSATVDGVVDSTVADLLYLHPFGGSNGTDTSLSRTVRLADAHAFAVHAPPDRIGWGLAGVHYAALATSPLVLIPYAGLLTVASMPIGFAIGYSGARARWSPLEAYRSHLPLFLDDRVRATLRDGQRRAGRLVDLDSATLLLAGKPDTVRVARIDMRTLQRASGYDFGKGALYGLVGGVTLGTILCYAVSACGNDAEWSGVLIPFAVGTIGVAISPAFAPRRWVTLPW